MDSVTALLDAGKSAEQILEVLLGDLGVEFTDRMPVSFSCNCDKERVSKALISVGKEELKSMIEEGKTIEVNCHFCNTYYHFTVEELKELRKKALR